MKNVVQDLTSAGLLGVWGKWVKHTKYIYNIQDFNPEQVLAVGYTKSKFITDAMMWFDKFSCKRSDLVITVGRDLVETVENRFKGKKVPKTVMINNWIDENEIYPLDESNERVVAFKKKYGLDWWFFIRIVVTLVIFFYSVSPALKNRFYFFPFGGIKKNIVIRHFAHPDVPGVAYPPYFRGGSYRFYIHR